MFKTKAALIAAIVAIGTSTAGMAATVSSSNTINLSASIPSTAFFALPSTTTFGQDEALPYNVATGTLGSLTQRYNFKSSVGSIKAYIEGGPKNLFNGNTAQNIPVITKFNNVVLTAAAQDVVLATPAVAGGTADLVISPGTIPSGATGQYSTAFTVIFENTAP